MSVTFTLAPPNQTTVEAHSRDEVHSKIHYGLISLNRYDAKYIADIWVRYLLKSRPISEGQNELWEKIIHKYRKQLKKRGVKYQDILALPWEHGIYTKDELIRDTRLELVEENGEVSMNLAFHFNKKVIEELRAIVHDDAGKFFKIVQSSYNFASGLKYDFAWSNDTRYWSGPYHPYLFRELYYFAKKHGIVIGTTAKKAIELLQEQYGTQDAWKVKIKIVNNRIYINNINEGLVDAIAEDYDFGDTSILNIENLCAKFGIDPPDSINDGVQPLMVRTSWSSPYHLESSKIEDLLEYLSVTNRKAVFVGQSLKNNIAMSKSSQHTWLDVQKLKSTDVTLFTTGEYDTLITETSMEGMFALWRANADAIKKHIVINETINHNN